MEVIGSGRRRRGEMSRKAYFTWVLPLSLLVVLHGESVLADTLRVATPEENARLEAAVFNHYLYPPSVPIRMTLPGRDSSMLLYLDDKAQAWHEPAFRVKKDWLVSQDDSVILAVHRLVAIVPYLGSAVEGTNPDFSYSGSVLDIIRDSSGTLTPVARVQCDSLVFPANAGGTWIGAGVVTDVRFLALGHEPNDFLAVSMFTDVADGCDEYESWTNTALWRYSNGALRFFKWYETERYSSGYGSAIELKTVSDVRDIDGDSANELLYSRSYIYKSYDTYDTLTTCSDPGLIVYGYVPGDPPSTSSSAPSNSFGNVTGFAPGYGGYGNAPTGQLSRLSPSRLLVAPDSLIPIRPLLPILIYPGGLAGGSFQSILRSDNWTGYGGPPTGGGQVIRLRQEFQSPYPTWGGPGQKPSLSMRIVGDSVEFVVNLFHDPLHHDVSAGCETSEYSVILWADTELYGDFENADANSDDIAFVVYRCSADSMACVERYSVEEHQGSFQLVLFGSSHGVYVRSGYLSSTPTIVSWKLATRDLGLVERIGAPTACGLAVEIVCSGSFVIDEFPYVTAGWTYPPVFSRTDPRTWGMLMVAERKDTTYSRER